MSDPLISIVIPTLNQAAFIEQTLASIAGQGWPRLEIIVIDGGSSDGTQSIVERYRHCVTHFVSEPDEGQANAVNKGMREARGDILAWINSDDYYLPLTFARIAKVLADGTKPHLVYGGCLLLFEGTDRAIMGQADPFDPIRLTYWDYIHQPSSFWTRALWEKTGGVNEQRHFILDWDLFVRASAYSRFEPIPDYLSVYRYHDAHKTSNASDRRTREVLDLVDRHAPPDWAAAYHAVARNIGRLERTWTHAANRRGLWTLHQLANLDLYARHGKKVDRVFSQLHVRWPFANKSSS